MPRHIKMDFCKKKVAVILVPIGICTWIAAGFLDQLEEDGARNASAHPRSAVPPFPGDRLVNLHWFVQISDLHISRYNDPARKTDLEKFCRESLEIIRPEVVLASGDLTDAKFADAQGSTQYEDEWQDYDRILRDTGILHKTVWLDVRGNHDAFNVPSLKSDQNFFRIYSVKGKEEPLSYKYVHNTKDGATFNFFAVDACPDPGPKRPFNFFGILTKDSLAVLSEFAKENNSSNMTIWFGHYPTSTIGSPWPGIRSILSTGAVYMAGHLHQLGGLVPQMHAMQKQGFLELELGDWKDNRVHGAVYMCGHLHDVKGYIPQMYSLHKSGFLELELADWMINRKYRVFAVDHDLFSFTDEVMGDWPIILITNPKHGMYNIPLHEPTGRIGLSTHIRVLVWSPGKVEDVHISIDGIHMGKAQHVEGPLYVLPWQPELYSAGIRRISVTVKDSIGYEKTVNQPFTLDNSKIQFPLLPRFVIMANHFAIAKSLFALAYFTSVLPLMCLKILKLRDPGGSVSCWMTKFVYLCLWRLHLVAKNNRIFYPVILFATWVAVGPWFVGEILDDHIGVCFSFGMYVNGVHLPGDLTYIYGFFQFITFNIPLTLCLGMFLDHSNRALQNRRPPVCFRVIPYILLMILVILQSYLAYGGYFKAYGTIAFLLCPVRTWSIFLAFVLAWCTRKESGSSGNCKPPIHYVNGEISCCKTSKVR